jgi:hypothetical protein
MPEVQCRGCGEIKAAAARPGQWWHVNDYHGFTGSFCPGCYDKISHDSQGQPRNPAEHLMMLLKLRVDKSSG